MTQVYDTPESIKRYSLVLQRAAVKLEAKGYKHSSGNVTPKLKKHYNLPRNATAQEVIDCINADIEALGAK